MKDCGEWMRGNLIELVPYDEKKIEYIYTHIVGDYIEGFENYNIKEKMDLSINLKQEEIKMFIKRIDNEDIIGMVKSYRYNKIDQYLYIAIIIDEFNNYAEEAVEIFLDYLFKSFPIRKVYTEIVNNHYEKKRMFEKMGFLTEVILKNDTFFDGDYLDKYILAKYMRE